MSEDPAMREFLLGELAKQLKGQLVGPADVLIRNVALLEDAEPGSIVHVADSKRLAEAEKSRASALLVSETAKGFKKPVILAANSKLAFANLLSLFHSPVQKEIGVHHTVLQHETASLGAGCSVGPYAVIEANVQIGARVQVGPFALIEANAKIGDDTKIFARASVLEGVKIGKRCILYEGCVIGSQGFGYATDDRGRHTHLPQVGTVILGDDVEVGANTTIDRATLGLTRIGRGTKIDNLVQIAHNCDVGEDCFIAANVGIAGSTKIGDRTVIAGNVGIRDHIEIGADVVIAGGSLVWGNVDSELVISGTPARPHKEQVKIYALLRKLPEIVKRLAKLEKKSTTSY